MSEREVVGTRERERERERERDYFCRDIILLFWVLLLVLILSLRKLWGFLLYGFLEENCLCLLSLVFISMHGILSFKYLKIMLGLNDKNLTFQTRIHATYGT